MISVIFNRRILVLAILFLLAAGIGSIQTLPRAEDPTIQARNAAITTLYSGAAATRVEALVTMPIEEELRTLAEVDEVSSTSRAGVSIVSVTLLDNISNVDPVWSRVRDKLNDIAPNLPDGASVPALNDEAGYAYTALFGVRWTSTSEPDQIIMQRYAEALAERLRSVPGTDYVDVHGDSLELVNVTIDEQTLQTSGLDIAAVTRAIANADVRNSAGAIANSQTTLTVELSGSFDNLSRLRDIPLQSETGRLLRLGDIATLERAIADPPVEISFLKGEMTVFVGSRMQPGQRVDLWVPTVLEAVDGFESREVSGLAIELVFEQATYTSDRLATVLISLLQGLAIVIAVLFFTMGIRSALSVGLAIPLTALMTIGLFPLFGIEFHQMSIIGVIVALGLMVDNAIIMTNDIRDDLGSGHSYTEAVSKALKKLFFPLMASTATTILAFMPIVLLPGGAGEFVGPMSIAVICALISSFVISMFVVPAMSPILFKEKDANGSKGFLAHGISVPPLARLFRSVIKFFVRAPAIGVAVSIALPVIGIGSLATVPTVFFPKADRDQFRLEVKLPQTTSIEQTAQIIDRITHEIESTEGVVQTMAFVGAAAPQLYYNVVSSESANPAFADIIVNTDGQERTLELLPDLQERLSTQFPNVAIVALRYEFGPPVPTPIEMKIFGPELGVLAEYGQIAAGVLGSTEGAVRTQVVTHRDTLKLEVDVDEQAARLAGLDLRSISSQLQSGLSGQAGGFVLEDTEQLPVTVRYAEADRQDLSDVTSVTLISSTGSAVPLSSIATVKPVPAWTDIGRLDGERLQRITSFVATGELPSVVLGRFQQRLEDAGFELPAGYRYEFGGEAEQRGEAVGRLLSQVSVLLVSAITILVLTFNSFRRMAIIFVAGILALGLGFLVLKLTGNTFGFIIIVGVMGLIGVGLNDTIVIVSALDGDEDAANGDIDAIADVVTGSTARHIWSTTITTAGGFVPLIFLGGDFWPPFAEVFAGGLLLLTIVAFIFTPSAYKLFLARRSNTSEADKSPRVTSPSAAPSYST